MWHQILWGCPKYGIRFSKEYSEVTPPQNLVLRFLLRGHHDWSDCSQSLKILYNDHSCHGHRPEAYGHTYTAEMVPGTTFRNLRPLAVRRIVDSLLQVSNFMFCKGLQLVLTLKKASSSILICVFVQFNLNNPSNLNISQNHGFR